MPVLCLAVLCSFRCQAWDRDRFGVRIVEGVHKAVNYSDYLSCEVLILNQLNDSLGFISKGW